MATKEVKKITTKTKSNPPEKTSSKIIKKQPLRIRELIEKNPTIWELTWVFLWRIIVLGFSLYFFIGIFIFLVAVFINNLVQLFVSF